MENNNVNVVGIVCEELKFSHEVCEEKFYITKVGVERASGVMDTFQVVVSEKIIDTSVSWLEKKVEVIGEFRSRNDHSDGKSRLKLFVFAEYFNEYTGEMEWFNSVELRGFICRPVVYRKTPMGREISDVMIAVNRRNWKSDYIPCIVWGRNARFASNLKIGDEINASGRIQSREYVKWIEEGVSETKTAYEISVYKFNKCEVLI